MRAMREKEDAEREELWRRGASTQPGIRPVLAVMTSRNGKLHRRFLLPREPMKWLLCILVVMLFVIAAFAQDPCQGSDESYNATGDDPDQKGPLCQLYFATGGK